MARPAASYRAARRNAAKRAKLVWRAGHQQVRVGGFMYAMHASMPQRFGVPVTTKESA